MLTLILTLMLILIRRVRLMGVKWLDDKADVNKLSIFIKERTKKGGEVNGYSLTLSKDFKEYLQENGFSHMRFGWNEDINRNRFLVLQPNNEEFGVPLLNQKGKLKLWLEFTNYYEQYINDGLKVEMNVELPATIKKNNTIEVGIRGSHLN